MCVMQRMYMPHVTLGQLMTFFLQDIRAPWTIHVATKDFELFLGENGRFWHRFFSLIFFLNVRTVFYLLCGAPYFFGASEPNFVLGSTKSRRLGFRVWGLGFRIQGSGCVPKFWRNGEQRNEHLQHRWMNWRSVCDERRGIS